MARNAGTQVSICYVLLRPRTSESHTWWGHLIRRIGRPQRIPAAKSSGNPLFSFSYFESGVTPLTNPNSESKEFEVVWAVTESRECGSRGRLRSIQPIVSRGLCVLGR